MKPIKIPIHELKKWTLDDSLPLSKGPKVSNCEEQKRIFKIKIGKATTDLKR